LSIDFERFDLRMKNLANHIRQAHEDAQEVHTTSRKISDKFKRIEGVELEQSEPADMLDVKQGREESG
jgi:DNA recombination protein RmuC